MTTEYKYEGVIPIRHDVTWSQVVSIWKDEPTLALEVEGEGEIDEIIHLALKDHELYYSVNYDASNGFGEAFDEFLARMTELSTAGWSSFEFDEVFFYGPTPLARLTEQVAHYEREVATASASLKHARHQLSTLEER